MTTKIPGIGDVLGQLTAGQQAALDRFQAAAAWAGCIRGARPRVATFADVEGALACMAGMEERGQFPMGAPQFVPAEGHARSVWHVFYWQRPETK